MNNDSKQIQTMISTCRKLGGYRERELWSLSPPSGKGILAAGALLGVEGCVLFLLVKEKAGWGLKARGKGDLAAASVTPILLASLSSPHVCLSFLSLCLTLSLPSSPAWIHPHDLFAPSHCSPDYGPPPAPSPLLTCVTPFTLSGVSPPASLLLSAVV